MSKLLKQAFTLIELLVVIAIIGILSGLIIVGMSGMTDKANIAKSQVFSNSLRNSLLMNLVSEWKFDSITDYVESNGIKTIGTSGNNVSDSWGAFGYNHGTASGGPLLKEGNNCVSGKCIQFDGNNDYVTVGISGSTRVANEMSIFAWIKVSSTIPSGTRVGNIIGNYPSSPHFNFEGYTSGSLRVYWNAEKDFFSTNFDMRDNKWHLVGFTRKLSTNIIQIYIDGVGNNSDTAGTNCDFQWPLKIGDDSRLGSNPGIPFNGLMDDIRIYNAAIPTSQIKEQYYAGLNNLLSSGQINTEEYSQRINSIAGK